MKLHIDRHKNGTIKAIYFMLRNTQVHSTRELVRKGKNVISLDRDVRGNILGEEITGPITIVDKGAKK